MEDHNKDTTNKNTKDTGSKNGDGANIDTANIKDNTAESVTMSKADYDKAIKNAEDKVKAELSKQIRDLEAKVKELSPVKKTQAEIDVENRLAALEASEKALAERERKIAVQEKLSANGLDKEMSDYLKDDADVDKLSSLIDKVISLKMKANGYKPVDHSSGDKVTPEEFKKWTYSQKAEFAQKHPEAYARLRGKK